MNLPSIIMRNVKMAMLKLEKYSPEILMVAGITGAVGSTVLACKATLKVDEVLEEHKEVIEKVHTTVEDESIEYSEEDAKSDLTKIYVRAAVDIAKLYAPSVILGSLSIASILASNNIMRKRNAALTAAYVAVERGYKKYRKNVIEKYGEEIDKELKYGLKVKEVEETVVDEKGKEKTKKVKVTVADNELGSPYATWFDERSTAWQKDAHYNLCFLKQKQNFANDMLRANGVLFLNQVRELIGLEPTREGQIVGWIYDKNNPIGDNYVDFGIYDIDRPTVKDFIEGYERSVILDFNVDGEVLNYL